jgi:mannose-6-phosphate isomerase-like protein (cupin superfamily)
VKFQGEFVWHDHADEDELFLVLRGSFRMDFRDKSVTLSEGDFIIVPRGVEHRPVAEHEVEVMLFEPAQIRHTGQVESDLTVHQYERI